MARKKKRTSRYGGLSREEYLVRTLGPTAGRIRARTSYKDWKRIRDRAHKKGLTVEGFLSNQPNALKERSPQGLRKEAKRLVETAYKPAEVELSQQEGRIKAIDEKRKTDNEYFRQWLARESAKMREEAATADQLLHDRGRQIQQDLSTDLAALEKGIVDQAQNRTGTVSNIEGTPLADLSPERQRAAESVANERQRTQALTGTIGRTQQLGEAANLAHAAARESKRVADTWNALKDVSDERTKLRFQKAADIAKEIARLLDREIEKAQGNREFDAVVEKLGLQAEDLDRKRRRDRQEARIDREKLDETRRHNRSTEGTDRAELRRKSRRDRAKGRDERAKRQAERKKAQEQGKPAFTNKEIRSNKRLFRRAVDLVRGSGFKKGEGGDAYFWLRRKLGEKFDPVLAEAAIMWAFYRRVDGGRAREFEQAYGFTP